MKIKTFSLPAGKSCPFAKDCKAEVRLDESGKPYIKDSPRTKFRCFSATNEVYPNVYSARARNFQLLREKKEAVIGMAEMIHASYHGKGPLVFGKGNAKLKNNTDRKVCRIHVSGDFFNEVYFKAWMLVARKNPKDLFYAYTKSVKYLVKYKDMLPDNLVITASRGGTNDELIDQYKLKEARVVFSEEEAARLGLEIDHDDSHAMLNDNKSFALLLHGNQPAGSEALVALKKLGGKSGYASLKKKKKKKNGI